MIVDTHCHYNMDQVFANWREHLTNAVENDVQAAIVVGTTLETSQRSIELAKKSNRLLATIGFHPNYTDQVLDFESLRKLAVNEKIVGIGETGLDFFRQPTPEQVEAQRRSFIEHIKIANQHRMPLIVHVRDANEVIEKPDNAYYQVLDLLRENLDPGGTFILHCVSGPADYVKEALDMGAYLGVAGNVTYKNSMQIHDLIKIAPIDKVLCETDAPFLTPQEFRGQPCEPWMIKLTAQFLNDNFSISPEQLLANSISVLPDLDATIRG